MEYERRGLAPKAAVPAPAGHKEELNRSSSGARVSASPTDALHPSLMLFLQRSAGNAAMVEFLQRIQRSGHSTTGCGGDGEVEGRGVMPQRRDIHRMVGTAENHVFEPVALWRLRPAQRHQAIQATLASATIRPRRPDAVEVTESTGGILLQRDAATASASSAKQRSPGTPSTLRMRDPLLGLKYSLEREGKAPLWSLLSGKELTLAPGFLLPKLLPTGRSIQGPLRPTRGAFGPLSSEEALRALTYIPEKPDWFTRALRGPELPESTWDLWLVYENDGSGIVPNFGSGSDQGRTAALYLFATFNKRSTGLARVGLTGIEMTTPRGTLPQGATFGPESTHQTPSGPYSGVMAADIGVTVSRSGTSKVDFIFSAGIDSREWGKLVQDTIHEKVSHSPVFPWPKGTKPLMEGGITWNRTIDDLTSENFAGLKYTGRLELDAKALTGTRRTEGTVQARFIIRTAQVKTSVGAISAEFSPVGALARGFVRYNDGREAVVAGVEGGVNASLMVNIGRIGLGLQGEAIVSTDPAFQTDNQAGTYPTALKTSPFVGEGFGMPAGHHGTGQLILKIGF